MNSVKCIACCVQIIDAGTTRFVSKKKEIHRKIIYIGWEILSNIDTTPIKKEVVHKSFTLRWDKNSALRKNVERWNGEKLTKEQQRRFDLKSLLSRYCQLTVERSPDWAEHRASRIKWIDALPAYIESKSLTKPSTQFHLFRISEPDIGYLGQLPINIQKKIKSSPEFKWAMGNAGINEEA
jgi:hypothetical protein